LARECYQITGIRRSYRINLRHDLGDDAHGTGYGVVLWIEEAVATRGFRHPSVKVHTHSGGSAEILPNLKVITGGAEYYNPRIADIIKI
jgi:hypothetical protein